MIEYKRSGFINQYPPLNVLNAAEKEKLYKKEDLHLYVHIPFCRAKCDFCYYLSFSVGNGNVPDEYIRALKREIRLYSAMPELQCKRIRTIYFGGGTPSLLDERQTEELVHEIKRSFRMADETEFCFEAGPDHDISAQRLENLKSLGVNRISIGCQSTDDAVLKANGRYRTAASFYKAFELIRKVGFYCVNTDIMSGLINQTEESFLKTVEDVLLLGPENISVYKLEIYYNNQLFRRLREGNAVLASDDSELRQVRTGYRRILSGGYTLANHFSFYSDPKFEHIHRRELWNGADMLGIGLSSHSAVNGCLYQNEASMPAYYKALDEGKLPVRRAHRMTGAEKIAQKMVLGLKNLSVDRKDFYNSFGVDPYEKYMGILDVLAESNMVEISGEKIKLTAEGALFADDIVKEFYLPQHKGMSLAHMQRPSENNIEVIDICKTDSRSEKE